MIRTAWATLNLIVATIPLGLLIIGASVLGVGSGLFDRIPRLWSRWLLWASGVRVQIQGAEHIARDRPQIIAANHLSWFDVLALAAYMPKRYRFIAKKELKRIPLFGTAWQAAGHIAIDRGDTQRAVESLDLAGRLVRADNSCVIIFPEGTRSDSDRMLPFKKGAFMLALHNGLDIVPTAIIGTRAILPKFSWRVRPGPIIVRFGQPVSVAGYHDSGRDALMLRIRGDIEKLQAAAPLEH